MPLIPLTYALAVAVGLSAPTCKGVVKKHLGFSFCEPAGWQAYFNPEDVFLCSTKRKNCVTGVGGFPIDGIATLAIVPLRGSTAGEKLSTPEEILRDRLHTGAAERTESVHSISEVVQGRSVHYVRVRRRSLLGDIADSSETMCYYAVSIDGHLFWIQLEFWADDVKSEYYIDATEGLIRSIRSSR